MMLSSFQLQGSGLISSFWSVLLYDFVWPRENICASWFGWRLDSIDMKNLAQTKDKRVEDGKDKNLSSCRMSYCLDPSRIAKKASLPIFLPV